MSDNAASAILERLGQLGDGLTSEAPEDPLLAGCQHIHNAPAELIPAVARVFQEAGYRLEMLTCLDYRAEENLFRLIYHFATPLPPDRHRLRVDLPAGSEAPSVAGIFESANWYEREVFDMFGPSFSGHPDMTRILTEEGADYHPLLKDFGNAPEEEAEAQASEGGQGA